MFYLLNVADIPAAKVGCEVLRTITCISLSFQCSEEQIACILSYALKGLEYLHLRRKIHRYVKLNLVGL